MIRIEITCANVEEPRARDSKHPCDSTRNRSLAVDVVGTMDDAARAVKRAGIERGWARVQIQAVGRRLGYVCGNCHRRMKGEI